LRYSWELPLPSIKRGCFGDNHINKVFTVIAAELGSGILPSREQVRIFTQLKNACIVIETETGLIVINTYPT